MSDNTFYVLPVDPDYVPSPEQQRLFDEYFMQVLGVADSHYVRRTEEPMLVSYGEVSRVGCPACGASLAMFTPEYRPSPHYAWFESVRRLPAYADCRMPCCGAQVRALDLELLPPYPYARFARAALNPLMDDQWSGGALKTEIAARFEKLLGTPIRQFWDAST